MELNRLVQLTLTFLFQQHPLSVGINICYIWGVKLGKKLSFLMTQMQHLHGQTWLYLQVRAMSRATDSGRAAKAQPPTSHSTHQVGMSRQKQGQGCWQELTTLTSLPKPHSWGRLASCHRLMFSVVTGESSLGYLPLLPLLSENIFSSLALFRVRSRLNILYKLWLLFLCTLILCFPFWILSCTY